MLLSHHWFETLHLFYWNYYGEWKRAHVSIIRLLSGYILKLHNYIMKVRLYWCCCYFLSTNWLFFSVYIIHLFAIVSRIQNNEIRNFSPMTALCLATSSICSITILFVFFCAIYIRNKSVVILLPNDVYINIKFFSEL